MAIQSPKISVATSTEWTDKVSGDKKQATEWHSIIAFRNLADIIGKYLKKGSQVYVEGKLRTRKWQAQDGTDRWTTEIIADQLQMLVAQTAETAIIIGQPNRQETHRQPIHITT